MTFSGTDGQVYMYNRGAPGRNGPRSKNGGVMNLFELRHRIASRVKRLLTGQTSDDYDWSLYHRLYNDQIRESARQFSQILQPGQYIMEAGKLVRKDSALLPLHTNWRLVYETVITLGPASVMEFGCGGGDHLANLQLLAPEIRLFGLDLSHEQLRTLARRHPGLRAHTRQCDITLPLPYDSPAVDLAYSQAVLMHIKKENGPLMGLYNMFRAARRQIVLMENWHSHHFRRLVDTLIAKKLVPWENVYFHYRDAPETGKPHLMVLSSQPLDFPALGDYTVLL